MEELRCQKDDVKRACVDAWFYQGRGPFRIEELHREAHGLTDGRRPHGPSFARALLGLVQKEFGEERAVPLEDAYLRHGVLYNPNSDPASDDEPIDLKALRASCMEKPTNSSLLAGRCAR